MEIKRWLCCVVNCVLVCCIVAKPVSLNKIIEAESQQKAVVVTTISPELEESEPAAERFSFNKELKPLSRISKKYKETGTPLNLILLSKKISPFKYRKTYQIKSPLKPKRVKHSLRTRHKQKNQSVKREIDGNAILSQKYIPLLKSLGMLFDNILGSDSGESSELTNNKRKRFRYLPEEISDEQLESPCKCPRQREFRDSESKEETVTSSETLPTEIPVATEASTETTDNTPAGDLRSFRQYKNVPLLLSRNTSSARRNDYGLGERSRAAHNGSAERHLSWVNRNSESNTARGQDKSNAESDEEHTDSTSRNDAGGIRARGIRIVRGEASRNNTKVDEKDTVQEDEAETLEDGLGGHIDEFYGQDNVENRRNEAESAELLSEPVRRQRGFLSEGEVGDTAESVQSEEANQKSEFSLAHDNAGDQRIPDRNGSFAAEIQKAAPRHKTIIHHALRLEKPRNVSATSTSPRNGPVLVIIDGYSVTRHKNGENKLTEKAIHYKP